MSLHATLAAAGGSAERTYSRDIFGGFLEHFGRQVYGGVFEPDSPLSDANGFREDVVAALRELKVPVIRWPGGCYASGYHWQDGVGPKRTSTDDMAWGVREPHTFGTDEFIAFCRLIDCEPYICNNAGDGTIEEMCAWVEYCNATAGRYAEMRRANGYPEPHNVKLWSIGNENYGEWEIGHKPVEQWAVLVRDAAKAMKATDPAIRLSAAAVGNPQWLEAFLPVAAEDLDYISIHRYWLHLVIDNRAPDYMACLAKANDQERCAAWLATLLDDCGYRDRLKILIDEWNLRSWHHPNFPRKTVQDYDDPEVIESVAARDKNEIASQYTMADAVFTAAFFNACLRHSDDIVMANIAPLVNTRGPLHVHPDGIVKRTHYHVFWMYANLLGDRVVNAAVQTPALTHDDQSIAMVDGLVTRRGESYAIALVNRHPSEEVLCRLQIPGMGRDGTYEATVLAGDSPDAFNDITHPDRVRPERVTGKLNEDIMRIAPHSLTIAVLPC